MRTGTLLFVATMLLTPASLAAQTDQPEKRAEARIAAALSAAAKAGIPASLLESKVAEGEAKGVPQDRIASAVEARLHALLRASSVLRAGGVRDVTAGELAVVADALGVNVADEAVVKIMKDTPRDRRVVAAAVLTQLVQLGHTSDAALLRVNNAVSAGAEALVNLQAEVTSLLRIRGLVPLESTIDAATRLDLGAGMSNRD